MVMVSRLPDHCDSQTVGVSGYRRFVSTDDGRYGIFAGVAETFLGWGRFRCFRRIRCCRRRDKACLVSTNTITITDTTITIFTAIIQYQYPMNMVRHNHKRTQFHVLCVVGDLVPQYVGQYASMR